MPSSTQQAIADPSRDNIRRYLRVHIDDENLVTDELVDYIHHAHTTRPTSPASRHPCS